MFRNGELNHKISRLHDTCFRLVYHDISLSEELLKKDIFFSTHYRNIQFLVAEMFRVYKRMSPKIMIDFFLLSQQGTNLFSQQEQLTS